MGDVAGFPAGLWVLGVAPRRLAVVRVPAVVLVLVQMVVVVGVRHLGVPSLTGQARLCVTDCSCVVTAIRGVSAFCRNYSKNGENFENSALYLILIKFI